MTDIPEGLEGDPRRRASAAVRGFHYQFWRTVEAWINLGPEEMLFVEGAEDFDRVRLGETIAVQVKDNRASGPLTLSTDKTLSALANFWNLVKGNRSRKIWFKFITTDLPLRGFLASAHMAWGCVVDAPRRAGRATGLQTTHTS